MVHDFFEFEAVKLCLLAIRWVCEVPCVAHSVEGPFEGRRSQEHFLKRWWCHLLLRSGPHRIKRTRCVLDFDDFIFLHDVYWSEDLLQRLKLIITAAAHVRFHWWCIPIRLLISAIQQWRKHYKHWVELRDSKDLCFFHYLIIYKSWTFADALLELEKLIISSWVENSKLFTIRDIVTIPVNFKANWFHIEHLTYILNNQ